MTVLQNSREELGIISGVSERNKNQNLVVNFSISPCKSIIFHDIIKHGYHHESSRKLQFTEEILFNFRSSQEQVILSGTLKGSWKNVMEVYCCGLGFNHATEVLCSRPRICLSTAGSGRLQRKNIVERRQVTVCYWRKQKTSILLVL